MRAKSAQAVFVLPCTVPVRGEPSMSKYYKDKKKDYSKDHAQHQHRTIEVPIRVHMFILDFTPPES